MRTFRDSVAKVTFPLKKHKKNKGRLPLVCAVPLRGYGFEIETYMSLCKNIGKEFPSPCGDVVLKLKVLILSIVALAHLFPSPYGDVVLKFR